MRIGSMFSFLDKLIDKLPILDRKERWKNQLDKLKEERRKLLKEEANEKNADRMVAINNRINKLRRLFKNAV